MKCTASPVPAGTPSFLPSTLEMSSVVIAITQRRRLRCILLPGATSKWGNVALTIRPISSAGENAVKSLKSPSAHFCLHKSDRLRRAVQFHPEEAMYRLKQTWIRAWFHPSGTVGPCRASVPICKMPIMIILTAECCKDGSNKLGPACSEWPIHGCYLFIPSLAVK